MPKSINLTGTTGKKYDLDEISTVDTRTSGTELKVQVWLWSPELSPSNPHSKPNPPKPELGQMWLSKLVLKDSDEYKSLVNCTTDESFTTRKIHDQPCIQIYENKTDK